MQSFRCRIRGHVPGDEITRNAGRSFARCARCGADLVEKGGRWSTPPRGARIVWAPAPKRDEPAPAEPETADQRTAGADRRRSEDRRKGKGPLPAFLRGKDRRSGQRDRRTAFGRRFRG